MDSATLEQVVSGGMWVAISALVVLVVFVIYLFRSRVEQARQRDALADAQFEAEILGYGARTNSVAADRQVLGFESTPDPPPSTPVNWDNVLNPPAEATTGTETNPPDPPALPAAIQPASPAGGDPSAAVLLQLQRAGIIHDIEAHMELNGNPKAATILKLKDGKRALLVSYFETEAFTIRNLKRFDLLIYVDRNGKAVVVDSVENFIAGRVTAFMR